MKRILTLVLSILLLLAAGGVILALGWQPAPFPADSASARRLQPGPLPVRSFDTVFRDTARPTAANGDHPATDSRLLEATVWLPAGAGEGALGAPFPLLVYSHGFSSSRREGAYLGEYLAGRGFVMVAIDFPLTNAYTPGGPRVRDVVNQPADVRFVIDRVLERSASGGDDPLAGQVDAGRIGVLGLSLGGLTTELVSFHPQMRDSRIRAALSIAGPTFMLGPRFFRHAPDLPFLMLAGDIDALVPWPDNAAPVPDKLPGAELVTLRGGSHSGFAGPAAWMRWMDNPDALGCYIVTRNIGADMDEPWFELIGTPAQGVVPVSDSELCRLDPLPEAMNVLRQQMITRVVVGAFFERELAASPARREAAARYLREQLAREVPEVDYAVSEPRVAAGRPLGH